MRNIITGNMKGRAISFKDRYKSEVIKDDVCLLTVFRYILNNPVLKKTLSVTSGTQLQQYDRKARDSALVLLKRRDLASDSWNVSPVLITVLFKKQNERKKLSFGTVPTDSSEQVGLKCSTALR